VGFPKAEVGVSLKHPVGNNFASKIADGATLLKALLKR
jgi:hypothetical protein